MKEISIGLESDFGETIVCPFIRYEAALARAALLDSPGLNQATKTCAECRRVTATANRDSQTITLTGIDQCGRQLWPAK
jgi:hypothetical protein